MKKTVMAFLIVSTISYSKIGDTKTWDKKYMEALPDSAFASVETDKNGIKHRHLPHHDASGAIDIPHLKAAFARWKQVRWANPNNAQPALKHLEHHAEELRLDRPNSRTTGLDGR